MLQTLPCSTAIILNVASGPSNSSITADMLRRWCDQSDLDSAVISTDRGEDIGAVARELIGRGYTTIVAAGGDGTVNAVAATLVNTEASLGIIPIGTLNHLARDLNIPTQPEHAIKLLRNAEVIRIDAGDVNGRVFINNASLGIYPRLVHERENRRLRFGRSKFAAMFGAAISVFRTFGWHHVEIDSDAEHFRRRTPLLMVANNEYVLEGTQLARRRSLRGGYLSLLVATPQSRWGLIALGLRAVLGNLRTSNDLESFRSRQFIVHLHRDQTRIALDGELLSISTPLRFTILAGALRVLTASKTPPVGAVQSSASGNPG